MKERNQQLLKEALGNLPQYTAPEIVWDRIEQVLDTPEDEELRERLKVLPSYTAPDEAWSHIYGNLNGRRNPTFLRLAAILLIICTSVAAYFWLTQPKSIPVPPPMSEKNAPLPEMTEVEIADFENKMVAEEAALKACIDAKSERGIENPEVEADIQKLAELTLTRDSLSYFLNEGQGLAGTPPRLDRLEARRKKLIKKLQQELCDK
ncbi:MAG: hypothetical protein AAF696_04760 [Bacteroidota bacterium]